MIFAGKYPKGYIMLSLIISLLISCSTVGHSPVKFAPVSEITKSALPFVTTPIAVKKDTTIKVELTDRQKLFYDKYFLPQFESLRGVIKEQSISLKSQAASIAQLSDMLTNMRQRAIKRTDSTNNLLYNDKIEYQKLQKIYLDQQKMQVAKNASQISELKGITDFLLALGVSMFLGLLLMAGLVWILWKKIEKLSKKLNYV